MLESIKWLIYIFFIISLKKMLESGVINNIWSKYKIKKAEVFYNVRITITISMNLHKGLSW